MFYPTQDFKETSKGTGQAAALVVLNVSESKRLIAKAVATLPEVNNAFIKGTIVIARGVTAAYIVEEILGVKIAVKAQYTMGCVAGGELTTNASPDKLNPYVLRNGKPVEVSPVEALKSFTSDDVFIKGASALDREGNAAVLVAHESGGTVGEAVPIVVTRGAHFIVGVGLEKLIPSVNGAISKCSIYRFKYATGLPCALFPLPGARVVTEIQALEILAGVSATQVAAGGIGGSEGAVVLSVEGKEENLEKAFNLVKSIKGEPANTAPPKVLPPASSFNYDAHAIRQNWRTPAKGL